MEPRLVTVWVNVRATLRASFVAETCGEGLVQPQVVPPPHGHEVAEPHVAKLVLDHHAEESQFGDRHVLLRAHDLVRVSDAADVFHGAVLVVRAHDVVHFCKWVPGAEVALVELERGLCDAKHEFVAQEFDERLAHEDALRHVHRVEVLEHLIGAGADCVQVGGDLGRLLELVYRNLTLLLVELEEPLDACALKHMAATVLFFTQPVARLDGVGDGAPVRGAEHDQGHLRL
mmetsp:Transcript_28016/g.37409  ORF Transcript_28016/g.37409 Transcript_28016/m.37409 type:complete len:231 (-) Transcript_28016:609-1301(-)